MGKRHGKRETAALALGALLAWSATAATAAPAAPPVPRPMPEDDARFYDFLRHFRVEAIGKGIKAKTYDRAIAGIALNARVKELNETQPEFVKPVWEYLEGAVSPWRIDTGREALAANAALFARIEKTYGVPKEIVAAIWGLESAYGRNTGSFKLFEALATLGYAGPRTSYGREQIPAALKLAERENIDPAEMTGSWAGAFGHTQFVATTFLSHAVDGDGDGKSDVWRSVPDALSSTAGYLKDMGWRTGESWGEEVRLPDDFPYGDADPDAKKPVREWTALGVRTATGAKLERRDDEAAIFLPAGHRGPAFLLRPNFYVILKYNFASSYALAIGHLSDRLRGGAEILGAWPKDERPLVIDERKALQDALTALGYDTGGVDGILGRKTRAALRDWQRARGLPPDGFATTGGLQRIAAERARRDR